MNLDMEFDLNSTLIRYQHASPVMNLDMEFDLNSTLIRYQQNT